MSPETQIEDPSLELNDEEQLPGPDAKPVDSTPPGRKFNPFILVTVLIVLLTAGAGWYLYAQRFEETDDAQVDGHINPISSRIDGTIKAVSVDDNQIVQAEIGRAS